MPGILQRYRSHLPINAGTPLLDLGEGNTPLIHAPRLSAQLGIELYLKFEGLNPTGSFKDRGMVLAVAKAAEAGSRAILCASTGNTSASAAAYGARAGLRCVVLIPDGKVALGKLAQAMIYGAEVLAIDGNFDAALRMVRQVAESQPVTLVNSLNPFRIEGQKTAAFEVCEELGRAPDLLAIPVGNAGNISAYWKGFSEYQAAGRAGGRPELLGAQAAGAAPLVLGHPVDDPQTIATAIRIGNPASAKLAKAALAESGGEVRAVSDAEILSAYRALASEGVFCEPASAAGVAGLIQRKAEGALRPGQLSVAVLTGNGLKDPDTAFSVSGRAPRLVSGTEELLAIIGL
jgi:threonine synthase